jgi:hypothetical protein
MREVCTGTHPLLPQTFFTRSTNAAGADAAPSADGETGVIASAGPLNIPPDRIVAAAKAVTRVRRMHILLGVCHDATCPNDL